MSKATSSAVPKLVPKLALAGSAALCALALALWFLRPAPVRIDQSTLDDPRVRDRVVALLADRAGGSYDSHNDAQVGRLLLKNQQGRKHGGITVDTNRFGLRERDYELPKPAGTVRVVLLGDSFIFGTESKTEDRLGVHLEKWLRERTGRSDVEVLHMGILSWNAVAEAVYLRRHLSLLQPDLVIQVTVSNDLDDVEGVRGFGGIARFTSNHRERAEGAIHGEHPSVRMGLPTSNNPLLSNHDAESRERWGESVAAVTRLAREVERSGGKYIHLFRWRGLNLRTRAILGKDLRDDQVAYVSTAFSMDKSTWALPDNMHWGPKGMREVALLCYGLIQQRGLLPMLALDPWDEANEAVERIHGQGAGESSVPIDEPKNVDAVLRLEDLSAHPEEGTHVYGGIDADGLIGPFASVSLRNAGGRRLHLVGRCLERPEMDGARVRVSAEGLELGTFETRGGAALDLTWPLPAELGTRAYLNVRLESDDWVYLGDDLQRCVVLRLQTLGVEP